MTRDDTDADLVQVLLRRVAEAAPGISQEAVDEIEREVREQFGGSRVFIPKRKKRLSGEKRQQAYQDGLSDKSTEQVIATHKISRATLYRLLKKGPEGGAGG